MNDAPFRFLRVRVWGGFERTLAFRAIEIENGCRADAQPRWCSGLSCSPVEAATRVQIPVGAPLFANCPVLDLGPGLRSLGSGF